MGKEKRDHRTRTIILGGNKMTKTTKAEKPTCTYELVGGYAYTACGQKNWEHTTADLTTCQNCGKKIKRVERNDG